MVKLKKSEESVGKMAEEIGAALNQSLTGNRFTIEGTSEIGASVSKDLQKWALIAILVSMLGIIIYLAWRFEFIFGVAAAIATFHDVLAVLGIFYLLHLEITLLVVTALLTLAGYSLTDTVVVFDRIRENLIKVRDSLGKIINVSINEVLSRTIVTSTTVFRRFGPFLVRGCGDPGLCPSHAIGSHYWHLLVHLCGQPHYLCLAQRH